jgi:hypothetical protein
VVSAEEFSLSVDPVVVVSSIVRDAPIVVIWLPVGRELRSAAAPLSSAILPSRIVDQ